MLSFILLNTITAVIVVINQAKLRSNTARKFVHRFNFSGKFSKISSRFTLNNLSIGCKCWTIFLGICRTFFLSYCNLNILSSCYCYLNVDVDVLKITILRFWRNWTEKSTSATLLSVAIVLNIDDLLCFNNIPEKCTCTLLYSHTDWSSISIAKFYDFRMHNASTLFVRKFSWLFPRARRLSNSLNSIMHCTLLHVPKKHTHCCFFK